MKPVKEAAPHERRDYLTARQMAEGTRTVLQLRLRRQAILREGGPGARAMARAFAEELAKRAEAADNVRRAQEHWPV